MYARPMIGLGDDEHARGAQRAADIGRSDGVVSAGQAAAQQSEPGARDRNQRRAVGPAAQAVLAHAEKREVVRLHVLQQRPALGDHVGSQWRRVAADVGTQLEDGIAHAHPVGAGAPHVRQGRQQPPPQLFTFGRVADAIDAPVLPGFAHLVFGAGPGFDLGMQRFEDAGAVAPHAQDRMDDQLNR